jgi:hypothetical protein
MTSPRPFQALVEAVHNEARPSPPEPLAALLASFIRLPGPGGLCENSATLGGSTSDSGPGAQLGQ